MAFFWFPLRVRISNLRRWDNILILICVSRHAALERHSLFRLAVQQWIVMYIISLYLLYQLFYVHIMVDELYKNLIIMSEIGWLEQRIRWHPVTSSNLLYQIRQSNMEIATPAAKLWVGVEISKGGMRSEVIAHFLGLDLHLLVS